MKSINVIQYIKWLLAILLLIMLFWVYKNYNPYFVDFFPKCPFLVITGLKCPGCGSQRAMHDLLNGLLVSAAKENILMVLSIPYLLLGFAFQLTKTTSSRVIGLRKILFGKKAIFIILTIIILFWLLRNIIGGF